MEDSPTTNQEYGNVMSDVDVKPVTMVMESSSDETTIKDDIEHDLTTLLSRPTLLSKTNWSTEDPMLPTFFGNVPSEHPNLVEHDFPESIFNSNPIVRHKLSHFKFFKADLEIEVKVQGTKFQQGMLLIIYNPYGDKITSSSTFYTSFRESKSSFPCVTLNLGNSNNARMTLPYAATLDMFDLSNKEDQFGRIEIYVLSELKSSVSPDKATILTFANFTKPTARTATLRESTFVKKDYEKLFQSEEFKKHYNEWKAQGKEGEASGPISAIGNAVGHVGNALSHIPLIGKVASVVGHVGSAVGAVAGSIGMAKATNETLSNYVINSPGRFMGNGAGQDYSNNLALMPQNAVAVNSIVPETEDEMSIAYIKKRWNIRDSIDVPAIDFASGKLHTVHVSPIPARDSTTSNRLHFGTLAYISNLCRYWRGSLEFKISLVKTCFHAGRIAVVYICAGTPIPSTIGDLLSTNYSVVIDIADAECDYEFTIPHLRAEPWIETRYIQDDIVPSSNGTFVVYSLSELVFPDTVSPSIGLVVSIRGGDDFELGYPCVTMAPGVDDDNNLWTPGSGEYKTQMKVNLITDGQSTDQDVVSSTMGEVFTSLRTYCKRFGKTFNATRGVSFRPDNLKYTSFGTLKYYRDNIDSDRPSTPLTLTMHLFRFFAGGNRVKLTVPFRGEIVYGLEAIYSNGYNISLEDNNREPEFITAGIINNLVECTIPYYGERKSVVNAMDRDNYTALNFVFSAPTAQNQKYTSAYEAASDDFTAYFLVGPTLMHSFYYNKMGTFN